jgi:plastocyanin
MRKIMAVLCVAVGVLLVAPLALAAPSGANVVRLTAEKAGLTYNTKVVRAHAGRIRLVFTNLSPLKHNVRLEIGEKEYGGTKTIGTGTTTAYVTLKAGKYHFYCSVPGHEDAGMSGYLMVS